MELPRYASSPAQPARLSSGCWRWAAALILTATLASPGHAVQRFTVCTLGAPEGFDIVQYESFAALDVGAAIFDTLVYFKPGSTDLVPALAERWDVSNDGLTYTFRLREGVQFHKTAWFTPTRPLTAEDVVWSINRMNDPNHPAHKSAQRGYGFWNAMEMQTLVRSVTAVDSRTVRFTLARQDATFLANLAVRQIGAVYSAEYGEQLAKAGKLSQLNAQPVGTGPFALFRYDKDTAVRLVAHERYWGPRTKIDQLVFAVTPDSQVRAQRLRAGECLLAQAVAPESEQALAADARFTVARLKMLYTVMIVINTKHKFVSDRRFREGLALAVNTKAFIKARSVSSVDVPASSLLPPDMWSHDASLARPFDPARAQQLIKASGYDGNELTLFIGSSAASRRSGEALQAQWAAVGVKVRLVSSEMGEHIRRTSAGEHDLAAWDWASDNGDPDNFLSPFTCPSVASGNNKSQWCHEPFDTLIRSARGSRDMAVRTSLYRKAQKVLYDEVPVIPLVYAIELAAWDRRVSGYVLTPFGISEYRDVQIK